MTGCGDVDRANGTGVRGCPDPATVYIEWVDKGGTEVAAVLCQSHAARLRAGEDIHDEQWIDPTFAVARVTLWRSLDRQEALAAEARRAVLDGEQ